LTKPPIYSFIAQAASLELSTGEYVKNERIDSRARSARQWLSDTMLGEAAHEKNAQRHRQLSVTVGDTINNA
jgi:hypothetical protein